ncbi:MAG TPA: 4'-phosphopantetheinyl transferase superfamily protein [Cellvibrionaceae bacterium]
MTCIYLANTNQVVPTDTHLQWLSAAELQRLTRQATKGGRQRFLASRLVLRAILANRLACNPAAVRFGLQPGGKPFIAHPATGAIEFSLSHSGDWIALAIGEQPLGVDVEQPQKTRDLLAIARQYFHPEETAHLQQLQGGERYAAFYRYWTLKEAFFKARGTGIAEGLALICIHPEQLSATLDPALGNARNWQLHYWAKPLPTADNCHLALAAKAPQTEIEIRPFSLP